MNFFGLIMANFKSRFERKTQNLNRHGFITEKFGQFSF